MVIFILILARFGLRHHHYLVKVGCFKILLKQHCKVLVEPSIFEHIFVKMGSSRPNFGRWNVPKKQLFKPPTNYLVIQKLLHQPVPLSPIIHGSVENIILYERKRSYWEKNTTHFPSFNSHDFWEEGSNLVVSGSGTPQKKISQNSPKNGHIWKAAGDPPFPKAKTASLWAARFCGGRVRLGRSGWTCMDHWSQAKFQWRLAVGGMFF